MSRGNNQKVVLKLKAYPNLRNSGDKVNLPEQFLQRLMNAQDGGAFYFEICKQGARKRIEAAKKRFEEDKKNRVQKEGEKLNCETIAVCGMREFTAPKGRVIVPQWLMKELEVRQGGFVELTLLKNVQKGRLVRLQPFKTIFSTMLEKVGSLKPIEDALVDYTALKKGTNIVVRHNNVDYKVYVMDTQPNDIVSVNHQGELKLDLEMAKDAKSTKLMKEQFGGAIESIWSSGDETDEDFDPDAKQDDRPRPGPQVGGGEEDLWTREDSMTEEKQRLRDIYDYNEKEKNVEAPLAFNRQGSLGMADVQENLGFGRCPLCHRQFPKSQLRDHKAQCFDLNMRCPVEDCRALIRKADLERHKREDCVYVTCDCGMDVLKSALKKHYAQLCVSRIRCTYCAEMFRFNEYHAHVKSCGERLLACPKCNLQVPIKKLLDGSHKPMCLMPCPQCGVKVRASQLAEHQANTCKNRIVRCETCSAAMTWTEWTKHRVGCERRHEEMVKKARGGWTCHACTVWNADSRTTCSTCGTRKRGLPAPTPTPAARPQAWVCGTCTFRNTRGNSKCGMCNAARPR